MKKEAFGKRYERNAGKQTTLATTEATFPVKAIFKNAGGEVLYEKAWDTFNNLVVYVDYTNSTAISDVVVAEKVIIVDRLQNPDGTLPAELS